MKFKGTILLVDDEAHIRKFIGLVLRQICVPKLLEASNGEEALAMYAEHRPDLVLLDVNMPKLGGLETLKQLHVLDPECSVVMLTSLVTRQTIEEASELGALNYIRKDTPKEEIAKALLETIEANFDLTESD
ncbi:MAG: response regulator transcription factor [Undibacterium sp.]|nr:response regulator transcription factor [Opitutaceae bacterium]